MEGASPGRVRLDMDEHGRKVGDLVWTRVQGYPWWPGQVIVLIVLAIRHVRTVDPELLG